MAGGDRTGAWEPEAGVMMFFHVCFAKLRSSQGDTHSRRVSLHHHSDVIARMALCRLEVIDKCLTLSKSPPHAESEKKKSKNSTSFFLFNEVEHS